MELKHLKLQNFEKIIEEKFNKAYFLCSTHFLDIFTEKIVLQNQVLLDPDQSRYKSILCFKNKNIIPRFIVEYDEKIFTFKVSIFCYFLDEFKEIKDFTIIKLTESEIIDKEQFLITHSSLYPLL